VTDAPLEHNDHDTDDVSPEEGATRRCIVTGTLQPREQLIRFVIGPDRQIWPDLLEKLPGRGLWVSCDAALLEQAIRKNLFAKAAKTNAKPAPDLATMVREQLRQRVIQLLGLVKRSGKAVVGFSQVEPAVTRKQIALLFIATDAGSDGRSKLTSQLPPERVITLLTSLELGQALGHDQLVYVGLNAQPLVKQITAAAMRFSAFIAKENVAHSAALAQIGAEFHTRERTDTVG